MNKSDERALRQAKMSLVAAYERGDHNALTQALHAHPAEADTLSDFAMALTATESYAGEELTPDVREIGAAAQARAFVAIFGAPAVEVATVSSEALSLKALRQARGVTLSAASKALGLGVDVLSALEAGRIRIASAPRRLADALAEMLDATANEISAALSMQVSPALRRGALNTGDSAAGDAQLDFAEAVQISQNMSSDEKALWLAEDAR